MEIMNEIMSVAITAAREAGAFLLENFGKILEVHTKADRNLATNLDIEAEKMIVARIRRAFPSHGILAEENTGNREGSDYTWIIDPLDGTHNFIRKSNVFGVSIGVMHKTRFIAGAVFMPADDEMFTAELGSGAFKNGNRIRVSDRTELAECSLSFDSSIRKDPDRILAILKDLAVRVFNVRMTGSSARLLTNVAEGRFDAAVEFYDSPWDFAGSVALIEEAGGVISDLAGNPLNLDSRGYLAGNRIFHEQIRELLKIHNV
jgi:myo-inositol-1(or 4)-monophosphatase